MPAVAMPVAQHAIDVHDGRVLEALARPVAAIDRA